MENWVSIYRRSCWYGTIGAALTALLKPSCEYLGEYSQLPFILIATYKALDPGYEFAPQIFFSILH